MKGVEVGKNTKLECKHFFGGAAAWVNGKIFASLSPVGFALKLSERRRIELMKDKGAKPLRYFSKSPIKKEYVLLPKQMIANNKTFKDLIKMSIEYAIQ